MEAGTLTGGESDAAPRAAEGAGPSGTPRGPLSVILAIARGRR